MNRHDYAVGMGFQLHHENLQSRRGEFGGRDDIVS